MRRQRFQRGPGYILNTFMNPKALLYCSQWPDDIAALSLDRQFVELQAYCLLRGLDVAGAEQDVGPVSGLAMRPGLTRALRRAAAEGMGHLVLRDPGQLARGSWEAVSRLRKLLARREVVVHVASWGLCSDEEEFQRTLSRCEDLLRLDLPMRRDPDAAGYREILRQRPLWKRMFGLLRDERYAEILIQVLFDVKNSIRLTERENQAVHGGYEHLQMFRALGFRIKGEDTDNTRLVADVLARHWDAVKPRLGADLCRRVESAEGSAPATGALL
jgi:hypothetical protein